MSEAEKTRERKELFGECETPNCKGYARWMSITEANVLGNDAPRRCTDCCDNISHYTFFLLESGRQTTEEIRAAVVEGKFKEIDWTQMLASAEPAPYVYRYVAEKMFGGND